MGCRQQENSERIRAGEFISESEFGVDGFIFPKGLYAYIKKGNCLMISCN